MTEVWNMFGDWLEGRKGLGTLVEMGRWVGNGGGRVEESWILLLKGGGEQELIERGS